MPAAFESLQAQKMTLDEVNAVFAMIERALLTGKAVTPTSVLEGLQDQQLLGDLQAADGTLLSSIIRAVNGLIAPGFNATTDFLVPFNNTINSTQGFNPEYHAHIDDGLLAGTYVLRPIQYLTYRPDGKFGEAVALEKGTTNHIVNGHFTGNLFANWTPTTNGDSTIEQDEQNTFGFAGAIRFSDVEAGSSIDIFQTKDYGTDKSGTVFALSVYTQLINHIAGDLPTIRMEFLDSSDVVLAVSDDIVPASYNWTRYAIPGTAPANTQKVKVIAQSSDPSKAEFLLTGVQLEESAFITSFVEGTRLELSSQVEQLLYPADLLLTPGHGTLALWVYIDESDTGPHVTTQSDHNYVCESSDGTGANFLIRRNGGSTNWVVMTRKTSDENHTTITAHGPHGTGWHHFCITWSLTSTTLNFYLDGLLVGSDTNASLPLDYADTEDTEANSNDRPLVFGGRSSDGTLFLNAMIDELFTSSRILDSHEIYGLARNDQPLIDPNALNIFTGKGV